MINALNKIISDKLLVANVESHCLNTKGKALQTKVGKNSKYPEKTGSYRGGYHAFKKILRLEEDGSKIVSREFVGFKHFDSDYISSAWLNPNGTRVLYCIPLDIDVKGTDKKWLDGEGRINWEKAVAHLQKVHCQTFRYLRFVVRSTSGLGIHLGIAISPIVKDGSDGSTKTLFLAQQAQIALIRLLRSEGLGADPAACGVIRDLPNWRRNCTSKYSKAKQLYFNKDIQARIKREGINVISMILAETNKLKQCKAPAKKDQDNILHPHKTTEARLAHLYLDLFDNLGQTKCYSMSELNKLTGISTPTLRNILVKRPSSRPKWLKVNYLGRVEGYELWIAPEYGDVDRALKLIENPEYASTFLSDLKAPEEVEDGERNLWLSSAAIHYKWHGYTKEETLSALKAHSKLIPGHEESRSCKNLGRMVSSIYRNQPQLFGIRKNLDLPVSIRETQEIKNFIEGPHRGSGSTPACFVNQTTHYSLAFTRRGNEKKSILFGDGVIIASMAVTGTGYEKQLSAIQSLIKGLERRPTKITVKGQCMFEHVPVAMKFSKFHGFEFEYEPRSIEDKRILREFRQDHHSPESLNMKTNTYQSLRHWCSNPNISSFLGSFNSWRSLKGEIKEFRYKAYCSQRYLKGYDSVLGSISNLTNRPNWVLGIFEKEGKGVIPIPRASICYSTLKINYERDFVFPPMVTKKVRCDGYLNYLDNYYWLGDFWIGRKLQVVDEGVNIEFFDEAKFIRSHKRLSGKGAKTEGGANSQWLRAKSLDSTYRKKAQRVGPSFDQLILAQIEKGQGIINTKTIFQFLRLMDSWPYEQLEAVANYSLKRRNHSYRFYNSCLEAGVE